MKKQTGFTSSQAIANRILEGNTVSGGKYRSRSGKTHQEGKGFIYCKSGLRVTPEMKTGGI